MTCVSGHPPLWEYECRSLPIEAKSPKVRGQDTVTGKDASESTTRNVESGKRVITITRGKCAFEGTSEELATRSATFTGNLARTDGLRALYEESFSFNESVNDETVGEGAIVGRMDSSMEGGGEGCVERTKSNICEDLENKLGRVIVSLFPGGGISFVGDAGEDGSVEPENEEARFLEEQVLMVSGSLREVEDALARFWGGEREDGSDMV